MRVLLLLAATAGLAGQSPRTPSCADGNMSECWIEVTNQPGCQFWQADSAPGLEADWSGECSDGLAEGPGTITWRACNWDNGNCMPMVIERSGSFLNGRRDGRWVDGPSDAAACHRWNTDMYFKAATLEEVTACLEAGADVNAYTSGYRAGRPLHHAVRKNELPIIELLLNAGADVDGRDSGGSTPLHVAAAWNDDPAIFKVLLRAGAEVNAQDNDWNTPLHDLATRFWFNSDLVNQSVVLTQILIDAGADVKARQRHGYTPLHHAARSNSLAVIEILLKADADVDARNHAGQTPLHESVQGTLGPSKSEMETVEMLLAAGADIMARDKDGETLLHLAALDDEDPALIKMLVAAGAKPMARDKKGRTPLHRLFPGDPALGPILLEAGAEVNARDNQGQTPLHVAAGFNNCDGVEWLLVAGADLEVRDNEGNTPLHSVFESDVQVGPETLPEHIHPRALDTSKTVEVLIKAGANLEARNHEANTPLHLAAKYVLEEDGVVWGFDMFIGAFRYGPRGQPYHPYHAGEGIRVLLAAGADRGAKNAEGKTPCDLYRSNMFLRTEVLALCQ